MAQCYNILSKVPIRKVGADANQGRHPEGAAPETALRSCDVRNYMASTFGMISFLSVLRSSIVFAVGTSANGGQSMGIVRPASL